jgi:hypothetical protein
MFCGYVNEQRHRRRSGKAGNARGSHAVRICHGGSDGTARSYTSDAPCTAQKLSRCGALALRRRSGRALRLSSGRGPSTQLRAGTKGRRLPIFVFERLAVPAALPAEFDATVADEKDFAARDLLTKQRVTRSCNTQQFSERGGCCMRGFRVQRKGFRVSGFSEGPGMENDANGRRTWGLSTLIEWPKNVRKRKISKVDRGFQGVARGCGLRNFFLHGRLKTSAKAGRLRRDGAGFLLFNCLLPRAARCSRPIFAQDHFTKHACPGLKETTAENVAQTISCCSLERRHRIGVSDADYKGINQTVNSCCGVNEQAHRRRSDQARDARQARAVPCRQGGSHGAGSKTCFSVGSVASSLSVVVFCRGDDQSRCQENSSEVEKKRTDCGTDGADNEEKREIRKQIDAKPPLGCKAASSWPEAWLVASHLCSCSCVRFGKGSKIMTITYLLKKFSQNRQKPPLACGREW